VRRVLGRGAMGVIYEAEDPDIGRTVAIKLVRADLLDGDDREQFLARFRHEARAAGRCTHANIVALYDFAMHEGNPFLAMEYVDGVPLSQALKNVGRFAPAEAVAIIGQVLDALGAAHSLGVVHRDVKPANILLLPSGQVKVTDFGISRLNTSELTQDGVVIGTPAYMSPEQCRGESVDARGDLFSAGTMLYELLTGARAFNGRNITEITYQLLSAEPREVTEIAADVPVALAGVLRTAMAKLPDARFTTAAEMSAAARAAVLADGGDQTVAIAPPPAFNAATGAATGTAIDDTALDTIERRLARHVGPIARHLVRDAARRSATVEALCETVARNIGSAAERERFLAESLRGPEGQTWVGQTWAGQAAATQPPPSRISATGVRTSAPATSAAQFSAVQIERVERALTKAVGPIAKVLVKRARATATSEEALWDLLAKHIERPAEREAFSRQKSGG
jgi:eukaryotic-like serine/threonine-protein kinase